MNSVIPDVGNLDSADPGDQVSAVPVGGEDDQQALLGVRVWQLQYIHLRNDFMEGDSGREIDGCIALCVSGFTWILQAN